MLSPGIHPKVVSETLGHSQIAVTSPFATLRLRTGAARRFKVVANATMLIWRVLRVVERRFRKLDAPELLRDVYEGRRFADGKPITRTIGKEAA